MSEVINAANLQPLGDSTTDFIYLYSDVAGKPVPGQFIISGGGLSLNGLAGTMTLNQDTIGMTEIDVDSSMNPITVSSGAIYRTVDDGVQVIFQLPPIGTVSFGSTFKVLGQGAAGWRVNRNTDPAQHFEVGITGYNNFVTAVDRYVQATFLLNYDGPTPVELWRIIELQGGITGT